MKIMKFIATEECTWKRNDQGEMAAFTVACQVAFSSLWLHSAIAQLSFFMSVHNST